MVKCKTLQRGYNMTNISEIIENILIEWAYRVHDGMPNPKNALHIQQLRESMEELNLPNKVIYEVIQNLINEDEGGLSDEEKEKAKKMNLVHLGKGAYGKEGGEATHQSVDGKLVAKDDKEEPEKETKPPMKIDKNPMDKGGDDDDVEKTFIKSTDMFKGIEPGKLKQIGDYEIKNLGLEYGYNEIKGVFKPAPGNAGSMLNEIISGEVANILQENPNLSEEELMDTMMNQFGETKLFEENKGNKPAGGMKKSEIPEGKNPGLHSKLLIAIRAGKRKHKKAMDAASKNNFENSQVKNYYGHKESFKSMINDLEGKEVIGPNGKPVPMEEAIELINSGGGGDNPSDTATLVFD